MRILLTSDSLAERAGSSLYVLEVARQLLARGHQPIAFSSELGDVAMSLRNAAIPVIQDLSQLAVAPDIIHGQHHVETVQALLKFPDVPAVSLVHGWLPWEETPLKHPRILRYVAVDKLCHQRLTTEAGIAPDRIDLVYNFVDLRSFLPRGPLPSVPRRALLFSNYASEQNIVPIVREACKRVGVTLDVVGLQSHNVTDQPQQLLPQYDVVFAKARAALEALASGCSVVLCDIFGLGPLVTSQNVAQLREYNFGLRTLQDTPSVDAIVARLRQYNPFDAAQASAHVRQQCDISVAISQLESIYIKTQQEFASRPRPSLAQEFEAYRVYIQWLGQRGKQLTPALQNVSNLEAMLRNLERRMAEMGTQLWESQKQRSALAHELSTLSKVRQDQDAVIDQLNRDKEQLAGILRRITTSRSWRVLRYLTK
jgi:hypothetical protein